MPTAEFQNPAHFKLSDTDAFLGRQPGSEVWMGIGPAGLENDKIQTLFERGDQEVERVAAERGYEGYWVTEDEARVVKEREERLRVATPGHYPWDDWHSDALDDGVDPRLAALGRSVIREASQHSWCDSLKYECGVTSDECARGLILEAKEQPEFCRIRWEWLLITDGLRFNPYSHVQMSPLDLEWNELRQRWEDEFHPLDDPKSSDAAFRRDAYRFITEFHQLDQLAIISLTDEAFSRGDKKTTFYAEYTVIETELRDQQHPHIAYSGIVRVSLDAERGYFDTAAFTQREEGTDPS
ncbi:MAG: hypothetical protein V4584_00155 [Verrucomicrobiota bacterium]